MPRIRTLPVRTAPGARVRNARSGAGLTQLQLAKAAGLHKITVSKIEIGLVPLSIRSALKIAAATGVSPGFLLTDLTTLGRESICPHCGKPIG